MVRRCLLSPTSVIGFDVLDELGAAPTTIAIAREGYRRTGEMLAPLLALLSLENGIRGHIVDDLLPPETMIGALPGWALDMFTREGRKALGLLLQNDAGIRTWARTTIGPTGRIEILAQALFRVESGLCQMASSLDGDRMHGNAARRGEPSLEGPVRCNSRSEPGQKRSHGRSPSCVTIF